VTSLSAPAVARQQGIGIVARYRRKPKCGRAARLEPCSPVIPDIEEVIALALAARLLDNLRSGSYVG